MSTAAPSKRAVGIFRISQVNGREEGEGFASPDVQRERIAEVCQREGLELVQTIPEMNVSGSTALDQRLGLRAAIEAVEAGRAEVIVVAYFDRLFRSLEVQAQVLRRVEQAGGRVLAADSGAVSNGTATQWLSATMLGMVAEYHNRITAEKCGAAQQRAIANGVPPMSLPPGLLRVGDALELDPEPAAVVAEAVRMRAEGATVAAVRQHLREHGIERSHSGTASLLRSPLLVGDIVFGKNRKRPEDVWRGTCPAIVDRETWNRAQRMVVTRGRKATSVRLLARLGVLRCGTCGARMIVGCQTHRTKRYHLYRCPPNGDCPRRVTISAEVAEEVVVAAVRAYLDGCMGVRAAQDNVRAAGVALARAQENLDAGLRTLADFTEPAAAERLGQLRQVRDEAREQADRLGSPTDSTVLLLADDWDELSADDRRRCIRAVLDRVTVKPAVRGLAPEDRIDVVYHDGMDVLKRKTPPLPASLEAGPVRLIPVAERDKALKNHLETTHFYDEATGELYDPPTPPAVPGWGEDGDEDDDLEPTTAHERHDTTQEVSDE